MSGYPDAPSEEPRPPDPREVDAARAAVRLPAVFLIVTGVLALATAAIGLIQLPELPAKMDDLVADINADPNLTAEQKDMGKKVCGWIKEAAESPGTQYIYVASMIASVVILLGGVKLLTLSGVGLPLTGSVLAMIPCTIGCCCLIGLPAGIWSLVVLNRPNVRAVIAARKNAPPPNPDEQYMR